VKPPRVFVDTGAWFAVQAVDDAHHREAVHVLRALLELAIVLVTTDHVMGETYALLRLTRGYRAARKFLDSLDTTSRLERRFVEEDLERRAVAILDRYRDHDFSYVDATSFALMRDARIRHAFAFDTQFTTAGFLRVPADIPVEQLRS
jgi:predicted nucleic acid-binding protein